jgi:hypothetical protein
MEGSRILTHLAEDEGCYCTFAEVDRDDCALASFPLLGLIGQASRMMLDRP